LFLQIVLSSILEDPDLVNLGFVIPFEHEVFVAITVDVIIANPEIRKIPKVLSYNFF